MRTNRNESPQAGGSTALNALSVFVDGDSGTVGLGIRERLSAVPGVRVARIPSELRKEASAKLEILRAVDVAVLCLPDEAAKETVALIDSLGAKAPKILDASTAHRVAAGWTFGFPELMPGQVDEIRAADRVTNPGCYATGALALLRPLVDGDIIPRDHPISINAVSGYSGGGRSLIREFESGTAPPFKLYGLNLEHKHVPEIQAYARMTRRPVFVPSVGNFRQGMLVSIPLHLNQLPGRPTCRDLHAALESRYAGSTRISVVANDGDDRAQELEPEALNDTNKMELCVVGHEAHGHAVLLARLDNLGKGASGAAIQNLELMLNLTPR